MDRIKKLSTIPMEHVVFQPGNATRYELLIGVLEAEGQHQISLQWLNRRGIPGGLFSRWDIAHPEDVAARLKCNLGDARPLAELMAEYMDRPGAEGEI